jgi:hypothetical protein
MAKKCIYCGVAIDEDAVIDFCEKCGVAVWGKKMFDAIVQNMENARSDGTLCNMPQDKEL